VGDCGHGRDYIARRSVSESLDSIYDAQPVTDAGNAHLFEGVLVDFQQNIATNITVSEGVDMLRAFIVYEPAGDVGIIPSAQEIGEGGSGWLIEYAGS
jgi:hypothetical protein